MTRPPLDPPFGAFALPAPLERLRRATEEMSSERATRTVRRLIRLVRRGPVDAVVFGDQKMRLHLFDNRTEKRIFCGSQFYDPPERAAIAARIDTAPEPFVFVDAGANVGAYTFLVRALLRRAGREGRLIAIEPDPINAARLEANLSANDAAEVEHLRVALSDVAGTVRFRSEGLGNRGRARVSDDGELELPAVPLIDLLRERGLDRVDVLKIDIEGHETTVLGAFLKDTPDTLLPGLVILETWHDEDDALGGLLAARGYEATAHAGVNTIYARPGAAPEMDVDDGET